MGVFFNVIRPIVSLIPIINEPTKKIGFKEKLMWTGITLLVFLVCSQIPLIGTDIVGNDPFYWMRLVMASNTRNLDFIKKIITQDIVGLLGSLDLDTIRNDLQEHSIEMCGQLKNDLAKKKNEEENNSDEQNMISSTEDDNESNSERDKSEGVDKEVILEPDDFIL
ncbi:hypothetical protein ENUP19_0085G0033 [Entamoeba nuttalli]|uniref:Translocon Sec61/SecY plug domain-containing protein n=1 Tax=Entamoeba nuttalli TaxID=412467 RepID=A0ABQ0DG38_9EUKA